MSRQHPMGITDLSVTVTAVDPRTGEIFVRDNFGSEFEIPGRIRPKGTGMPSVGERWIVSRKQGLWVLDRQIGAVRIPVIEGNRVGLHPIAVQLLEAMDKHGLIRDETTGKGLLHLWGEDNDPPEVYVPGPGMPTLPPEEPPEEDGDTGVVPPEDNGPPPEDEDDGRQVIEHELNTYSVYYGSFNIKFPLGAQRAKEDLLRFTRSRVQVFGLQEFWPDDRVQATNALDPDEWGFIHPATHATGREIPIFWRKNVFEKMDDGRVFLSPDIPAGGVQEAPSRHMLWVKLRHKKSRKIMFFANTHFDHIGNLAGDPSRIYHQTEVVASKMQEWGRNHPVITVGDFNRNYPEEIRERNPRYPYVAFGRVGTRANWDLIDHRPAYGTKGSAYIDYVWFTRNSDHNMRALDHWILTGYHSDHRPLLVRGQIKI